MDILYCFAASAKTAWSYHVLQMRPAHMSIEPTHQLKDGLAPRGVRDESERNASNEATTPAPDSTKGKRQERKAQNPSRKSVITFALVLIAIE